MISNFTGYLDTARVENSSVGTIGGYDFHGVEKPKNELSHYGLRYAEFVVPLVKAVQELTEITDEQKTLIEELRSEQEALKSELRELSSVKSEIDQLKAIVARMESGSE